MWGMGKQTIGLLLILLIASHDLGVHCEAEKIPFVAEVSRYPPLHADSWTSSSTPSTRRNKSSSGNSSPTLLTLSTKYALWH